jgi:DNA mismatch endonuclease (patch repair protein)
MPPVPRRTRNGGRKLDRNIERDQETNAQLLAEGWMVLRFWEHESPDAVMRQVAAAVDREKAGRRKRRQ